MSKLQERADILQSRWRKVIALGAWLCLSSIACAQTFPSQTIRIVSPYTAGGLGDILPRIVAAGLSDVLGTNVIVENVPGASQVIGVETVMKAKPDGHTLLFASSTSMGINVAVSKTLRYDPLRDFAPIAIGFSTPLYLAVNPKLDVHSVQDLVALAKKQPGKLSFASGGTASSNHLAGEMFKELAGIDLLHVPYKGMGPALTDLLGGHVDMIFAGEAAEQARQGLVRALAVSTKERSRSAPDIPTMQEAGVKDYDMGIWFGFMAPAGTPKPVIELLSQSIRKVLDDPKTRERANGTEITPSTPEEMAARIPQDIEMWRKLIRDANVTLQ
jgi:tripartite-type tricarboxylate transporter receptor subunit TctC